MRGVVWLVLLFVVAVVAATTLGANDGLVSIYWNHWRTDLSLNFFLVAMLVLCAAAVAVVHTLARLVSLPRRAGEWRALRRERAAEAALREAQAEHHAGRYARARKAALRALALQADAPELAADSQFRVLAHLQAAASMHRLQDRAGRDEQLQLARAPGRRGGLADALGAGLDERGADGVRMLAAEWALEDRDGARALEALAALAPGVARRTQALRLRLQAQRLARQPLEALRTARLLANHQAFTPVVASGLLRALAGEAMDEAHDAEQLRRVWNAIDDADRRDVVVVARAAARAVQLGAADDARRWLWPFWQRLADLDRDDRAAVALALFEARAGIGSEWLPVVEAALRNAGHEAPVQAAGGGVFASAGLWGKARRLLEPAAAAAALPARHRRAAWRELAALARHEGDEPRAQACEREAAAID